MTSHWQAEGSGSKSESLNDTNHSYLLKDILKEVEAEALGPVSGRHSTIRIWEPGKEPHPFSTKLERRLPCWEEKTFIGLPQEAKTESLKEAPLEIAVRKLLLILLCVRKKSLKRDPTTNIRRPKEAQIPLQSD